MGAPYIYDISHLRVNIFKTLPFFSLAQICAGVLRSTKGRGAERQANRQTKEEYTETGFIVLWGKKKYLLL